MENFTPENREKEISIKEQEAKPLKSKESESKFNFRTLYSSHDENYWSPEELEKELQDTDIWFPEVVGWNKNSAEMFKAFATGKHETSEVEGVGSAADISEFEALRRIGKSGKEIGIGFADLPEGHPLLREIGVLNPTKAFMEFVNGNLDNAIREIKLSANKEALAEKAREEYIQQHTKSEIDHILSEHPKLKNKLEREGKLNILMTLGTIHTGVSHGLKKEGHSVERKFNYETPYTFGPINELIRRFRFGKEVSDELAAQVLFSIVIMPELKFLNPKKLDQVSGKISRSLSLEDIRNISSQIRSNSNIRDMIKKYNINIPQTEEEADELLSGKKEGTKSSEAKTFKVQVMVDGRIIDTIEAPIDIDDKSLRSLVFRHESVNKLIRGRELKKYQHTKSEEKSHNDVIDIQMY